jgi:hypothetical protein
MTDYNPPAGQTPWQDSRQYVTDHHGKRVGLNWDFIRGRFMQNCSPDELTAQIRSMRTPVQVKAPAKNVQPNALSLAKVDLLCKYYLVGNKIPWIAKEMEIAEATVRKYLIDKGIYEVDRDRGRAR